MDHPWRRLRDRPDWLLEWDMLPPGLMGSTCHRRRVITLDLRLSQAERRCTIAHELEHVERGPMPSDPILAAREEESIERAVARRLVTIRALGDALAWAHTLDEAAEELWVDVATLEARLRSLHPAEHAYLNRRLGQDAL